MSQTSPCRKRSPAKKIRQKGDEESDRSIRKSDRKVTKSIPKTKKSDRTPFAALLLRHRSQAQGFPSLQLKQGGLVTGAPVLSLGLPHHDMEGSRCSRSLGNRQSNRPPLGTRGCGPAPDLKWPHTARYCDAIAAIPPIDRYFLSHPSNPPTGCDTPLWCLFFLHRHISAIPHFATYRAILVRYPRKTSAKQFCDTIAESIARYEKYRCWAS